MKKRGLSIAFYCVGVNQLQLSCHRQKRFSEWPWQAHVSKADIYIYIYIISKGNIAMISKIGSLQVIISKNLKVQLQLQPACS